MHFPHVPAVNHLRPCFYRGAFFCSVPVAALIRSLQKRSGILETAYNKKLLHLILTATVIRCIVAAATELGNDEVYYWTYSQKLQWNYFDHPPMVAVWIKLFTLNLWLQSSELFIRLGSIVSAAICTWLLYKTVTLIHSKKGGWYAACLYTASIYASIIAGIFIMPDSPQMLFWCGCLYLLAKLIKAPHDWMYWILFGMSTGLCLMSKVHAVFIPFGLLLFMLFQKKDWFKLPQLYIAALIAAAVASPILFWNFANDFATYRFHSERVAVERFAINTTGFFREVFGQIGYNNPFNVALIVLAFLAVKKRKFTVDKTLALYSFIAVPMIFILIVVALFRNTFPHWSGPAYVSLLPLAAVYLTTLKKPVLFPKMLRWALGIIGFAVVAGLGLIHFYPGTLGKKNSTHLGSGDFTLDLHGWTEAGSKFAEIYKAEIASGMAPERTPLVNYKWFPAAHLDYYFCRPLNIELIGLGSVPDLHHYIWMNRWREPKTNLQKAYAIVPANLQDSAQVRYKNYYSRIDSVTTITQTRSGATCRYFTVYRLSGWKGKVVGVQ